MRTFNGKPIELLAPAGNFEIFQSIVESKCDAIYFGGQTLNMRLIRKGFNFTDDELRSAVDLAHSKGKRAYITVNNLMDQEDIEVATQYLKLLADIKPDALIVQDLAIVELIKSLGISLELHASVMMNCHNSAMVNAMKAHGVTRVVLSREASLEDARRIHDQTGIEIEYFTHGDMCVTHGAQCYYSSMLFGMSSNRGKCLKPCRWWFGLEEDSSVKSFPMAVKDLSLFGYLPEMVAAGITSFKIEGRMREKAFICKLVDAYGDALDRLIADPVGYDRTQGQDEIMESRKRDLSTGYAFGNPGLSNINIRGEGTGAFYSTGKMFSVPTEEKGINQQLTDKLKETLRVSKDSSRLGKCALAVKVQSYDQACVAIDAGVDRVYLTTEVFKPHSPLTIDQIKTLSSRIKNPTELFVVIPRMMTDHQMTIYKPWLSSLKGVVQGVAVGNLGALQAYKDLGFQMVGDYSLNIMNALAADFYKKEGLSQVMASLELSSQALKALLMNAENVEVIGYGRVSAMYSQHDFYKALNQPETGVLKFYNEAGVYEIYKDAQDRNHLLTIKRLNFLPLITELRNLGVSMIRIEAQTETPEDLEKSIQQFMAVLKCETVATEALTSSGEENYTYGALPF